jgi:formylglycine-generating enzyme required for sulfatase activity
MKIKLAFGFLMTFFLLPNFPAVASVYSCDTKWTARQSGTSENLKNITWDGKQFTVFANSESDLLESEDGIHWNKRSQNDAELGSGPGAYVQSKPGVPDQEAYFLNGAVFSNGTWVTFIDTRLYSSKDKKVWKLQDRFIMDEEYEVGGEQEVEMKSALTKMRWIKFDNHKAYASSDGKQWHEQQQISMSFWGRLGVAVLRVFKNQFVAINYLGSTYVSQDGVAWSDGGEASRPGSIASNDETLVLVSWYGSVMVSNDAGRTWVTVKSDALDSEFSQTQYLGGILWNKGNFFIVNEFDKILHSKDGNIWEKDTLNINLPISTPAGTANRQNTAWKGDVLVSVDKAGVIYTASCQQTKAGEVEQSTSLENNETPDFINIHGGCFNRIDDTHKDKPQQICVKDFWLGVYEVTQSEWRDPMNDNPSFFKKGSDFPVDNVSYTDVQSYLEKLNRRNDGLQFRLPTEDEWEFACTSGGRAETYSGSEQPGDVAWYETNSQHSTHTVGRKASNGLGLFDMSGNVEEWVENGSRPSNATDANTHIIRGGAWNYKEKFIRCDRRGYGTNTSKERNLGFRLVMEKRDNQTDSNHLSKQ